MAQAAETSILSESGFCISSSFDSELLDGKSRTVSTSSSVGMDSNEEGGNYNPSSEDNPGEKSNKSSTSSYTSCNNEGADEVYWNNFVFRPVQPEDYPKILAHMRESFYRDEPLNLITGYSEEKAKDMDLMITKYFKDGLSSIVLEKDTNKVAGARIIAIHRRNDVHNPLKLESPEMKKIMPFLGIVDSTAAIFDHYPELNEYAELFMASVHPDFRGQGLAGEMYRGVIRLLQGKGFKLLKSCFTSPFTKKIGDKMGFRELARAKFNEYQDGNGELVFPNAKDDEVAVIGVLEI